MSSRSKAAKESTAALLAETPAGAQGGRTYSIGDLSREFGVTLRTLRFYEDRGLLSPRREGMVRIYDARDRARLSVILKGKQLGFTLAEIEGMLAMENRGETPAATLKLSVSQIDDQIAHLERQREEIDQAILELREKQSQIGAEIAIAAKG
jgi:DNA-binding transcriptional MerR regulator